MAFHNVLFVLVLIIDLCLGSAPSVNVKIGGKLPKGGSVQATCAANGKKGMAIKWYVVKPNNDVIELTDGVKTSMHDVQRTTKEVNSTFVQESVTLTIKYDLMSILSYFKCALHGTQDLSCQGSYKCIADFAPPKRGVYMENNAIVNLDGVIRLPPRAIISKITTDSTSGKVFWTQVAGGEVPILRYEVMYKLKSDFRFVFTRGPVEVNTARTAVITKLKPYTEYNIFVVSVLPEQLEISLGKKRNRIESPLYRLQTDVDGPEIEPKEIKAASVGSNYIYLEWQQPPTGSWNGPLNGFYITYKRIKHGDRVMTGERTFKSSVKGTVTKFNATQLKPWSTYLITACGFNRKRTDNSIVYGKTGNLTVKTYLARPSTSPLNLDIVKVTSSSAQMKWEAPSLANANGPIDGYILRYKRMEIGYMSVKDPSMTNLIPRDRNNNYTLTGLLPWSTYSVEVIAYNMFQGKKLESDASHALVIQTWVSRPETAPRGLVAEKIKARSVLLSWQPPSIKEGANGPIDGYKVIYKRRKLGGKELTKVEQHEREVEKGENGNFNLSGLHPWSKYSVQIAAFNLFKREKLTSRFTKQFNISTRVSEPEVSSSAFKSLYTSSTYASLSWSRPLPQVANGPISGYVISFERVKSGGQAVQEKREVMHQDVSGDDEIYRLDQLKPWSTYAVSIRSFNVFNEERLYSKVNERLTITTEVDKPTRSPSIINTVKTGHNFIEVSWKPLIRDDQNGPLDGYEVFYKRTSYGPRKLTNQKPKKEGVPGTVQVYKLTNLAAWSSYDIWVLAYNLKDNEKLASPVGKIFTAQTKTGRPSVTPASIEIPAWSAKSITISWKKPKEADLNGELIGYVIRVNGTSASNANRSRSKRDVLHMSVLYNVSRNQTSFTVKDLKPASKYSLEVAAKTSVGMGPYSKPVLQTTGEDAPTAPRNPRILSSGDVFPITIGWDTPLQPNGKITTYLIEIFKMGPNTTATLSVAGSRNSYNISSLDIGNKHLFRVQAKTVRSGKWSLWAVLYVPDPNVNTAQQTAGKSIRSYLVPIVVGAVLLACFIIALVVYRRMKVTEYDLNKSQEKARLTNIDVEMDGVQENKGTEEERMLDDVDDIEIEQPVEREKILTDEDENMNNNETKKIPCSTPPPSSLPCDPAHPPVPVDKFQDHVHELKANHRLRLKEEYKEFKVGQVYTWDIAMKPKSKAKNRYANIVAYDHSRVILKPVPGDVNGSDYINASYIDGYHYPEEYIATQGPTEDTVIDFWRMIWQERSSTIVCLTNLHELGKAKCNQYWPAIGEERYGGITVTLVSTDKTANYIIRTMDIRHDQSDEVRQVCQFHFLSWPDHGTPIHPTALLSLRRRIRHFYDGKTPMILHCSAGVGRTGCFILIDEMLERSAREGTVDIYNYLNYLRTRRINMVQTEDQYMFVHDSILESMLCGNTEMLAKDVPIMLKKFKNIGKEDGLTHYQREFKKLSETCPDLKWEECTMALQPENLKKSRSLDIIARDCDRVILSPDPVNLESTYINAVTVDGYKERNAFILTEAPMQSTVSILWKMVYEKGCRTIVVLYGLKESSETYPCFWPADEGEHAMEKYGGYSVEMISEQMDGDIFSKRLALTSQEEPDKTREVQLLQYVAWPYHDVPDSKRDILALISRAEESQRRLGSSPILVICSDGASRCGTFCSIYNCIERVKVEQIIDVFQVVRCIRLVRPHAVATVDQMEYIYEMVLEYLNSFDNYINFN